MVCLLIHSRMRAAGVPVRFVAMVSGKSWTNRSEGVILKKWAKVAAAAALVLAGLFTAQSASASGSWQPYPPGGFTTPSNWTCGPSDNASPFAAQTCTVRSGNYVQTATIVSNGGQFEAITSIYQWMENSKYVQLTAGSCSSSGIAANSVSVCFTPTVYSPLPVKSRATSAFGVLTMGSPWA